MDVSKLSLAELKKLLESLPKLIGQREKEEKATARKELEAFAREKGFTLSELLEGQQDVPTKTRIPVAPKYKNPETGDTWTGRGRSPSWLVGKNKDDYKI